MAKFIKSWRSKLKISRRQILRGLLTTTAFGATLKLSTGCGSSQSSQNLLTKKPFKILSCDGGGIKGLMTAIVLERLEEKLQQAQPRTQLRDYFDLFAGVSTGSIIACALAKGVSAATIKTFYLTEGKEIFPNTLLHRWEDLWDLIFKGLNRRLRKQDLSLPIFEDTVPVLEAILQREDVFGQDQFETLSKATLVLAYDTYNRRPIVFHSEGSSARRGDARKIEIWRICRASTAVPTLFPGYFLENETFIQSLRSLQDTLAIEIPSLNGRFGIPLIDGAVVTNNPALWAIAHARQQHDQPIWVAAFGTGRPLHPITPEQTQTWGPLDWVNPAQRFPLLDVMFDGSSNTVNEVASQILNEADRGQYWRYQPLLEGDSLGNISAFSGSDENLGKIQEAARIYLEDQGGDLALDQLVATLQ